jgi:ParB family chromosome partitioning protein
VELELHQLELRYEKLRRKNGGKERRLLASLSERGQLQPVVVVRDAGGERYVLVDGYKRLRALRKLKHDTVRATTWDLCELEALLLERVMRASEADSALEQGFLLCELNERFGLSQEDLARRFDKNQSWVSQRLGLVRALPEQVQQQVQSGRIAAYAATKYLVPMARAKRADCVRLVTALEGHQASTRDVAHLYMAWANGDEHSRERLLAQPHIVLRAREQVRLDGLKKPAEKTVEQALLDDLSVILGTSRRARAKLTGIHATQLVSLDEERARGLVQQAQWECEALFRQAAEQLWQQRVNGGAAEHGPARHDQQTIEEASHA